MKTHNAASQQELDGEAAAMLSQVAAAVRVATLVALLARIHLPDERRTSDPSRTKPSRASPTAMPNPRHGRWSTS
ncbi:hypothetical protein [Pseudorhodoferax sp.]|uniref:hypothetical protein n=1 Tax=Pseudorhodoferax sp. TaxID=1993553 RepID=UPI0039E42EB2